MHLVFKWTNPLFPMTGSYTLLFHWTGRTNSCTLALCSSTHIYRESKAAPSLEAQQALQMARQGSTALPIPLGTVPPSTGNPLSSALLGMKGSRLSVTNLCPHWIPTPVSVLCLNDLYIQAYIRQLLSSIIIFFNQNSASFGFSPKKYLSTF